MANIMQIVHEIISGGYIDKAFPMLSENDWAEFLADNLVTNASAYDTIVYAVRINGEVWFVQRYTDSCKIYDIWKYEEVNLVAKMLNDIDL